MKLYLTLAAGIVLMSAVSIASADTPSTSCPSNFKTYQEVILCAEGRSPEVQTSRAELERAKTEIRAASQWRNPELSSESFHGSSDGQSTAETDISLGVPIELGGKISARRAVAEGGVAEAEAKAFESKAKVRAEILLKLHRLRQLYHEQEVIDEAIGTFTKLVSQYSKRPNLSPEQKISATVFKMSKSEYEIKKTDSFEELASLNAFFKVAVGNSIEQLKSITPESVKKWPIVKDEYLPGNSPLLKVREAEIRTSQASLSLAQSESWPTVTVGPSFKIQNQGGQTNHLYGFNLSFPLPLFNANGGGRAAAASGVQVSETKKNMSVLEEGKQREGLVRIYAESTRVLLATLSHQEIENRHTEIESLFLKGIVPSSLVIEAHRTFVELELTRNQRELKALESLLLIYTIDGHILEANL